MGLREPREIVIRFAARALVEADASKIAFLCIKSERAIYGGDLPKNR